MTNGFFAFPSDLSITEIIEDAIEKINGAKVIEITSWRTLQNAGKSIMTEICTAIGESQLFLADLTHLNPNVLFELGFAIARNKRICLFHDPSIERSAKDVNRFTLSTVGFIPYHNSTELMTRYFENAPHEDIHSTVLSQSLAGTIQTEGLSNGVLYLKSPVATQASLSLSQKLSKSKMYPVVIDDPAEIRMQLYNWYVQEAYAAFAVVAHLLSHEQTGHQLHNAKASFAAGLGYGFGKQVLMLSHYPYTPPFDYRHLLQIHRTAHECETHYDRWASDVETRYFKHQQQTAQVQRAGESLSILQALRLGDFIAEREVNTLSEYFVDTAAYGEAVEANYSLFIGRKGTGKTAILYQLNQELSQDKRNHVCIITPLAYELEGLVQLLQSVKNRAERGFLVESLWKYLLYTEIALSYFALLNDKPPYYEPTPCELKLKDFIASQPELFDQDFSVRLGYAIRRCNELADESEVMETRLRISEMLHATIVSRLSTMIRELFQNHNRVAVLVDNLDKAWKQGGDIGVLSEFLFGLLGVSNRVINDLRKPLKDHRTIGFSLVVFLRSDIFARILKVARERDKMPYYSLRWDDPALLANVIERRLMNTLNIYKPDDVWRLLFCSDVKGIETKKFVLKNVLPRPRDIIFWIKAALALAIQRRHNRIEEEDIIDSLPRYSQHAIDSLIVENGISIDDFENLLYEFAGGSKLVTDENIATAMERAGIADVSRGELIELLCERSFFGRQVGENTYRFQYDGTETEISASLERNFARKSGRNMRCFLINDPFCHFLEITCED